jgi:hypothetical protein
MAVVLSSAQHREAAAIRTITKTAVSAKAKRRMNPIHPLSIVDTNSQRFIEGASTVDAHTEKSKVIRMRLQDRIFLQSR